MTTKKTPEDNQEDWSQKILARFKKVDEVFKKARAYNSEQGISKELERQYVSYSKPQQQKSYEHFLHKAINSDTQEWNTIKYLRATKQIGKTIESGFENRTYPRVETYRIIRIKTRTNEDRIYRCMNLIALDTKGKEIAQWIDDIDLERIPSMRYETLPLQTIQAGSEYEEDGYGRTNVATVTNHELMFMGNEISAPKYLVPFSEQTINEWIEEGKDHLYADPYNGISFSIKKEGETKSYDCNLQQFLTPSFDQLYEQLSTYPKTMNEDDLRRLGKLFRGDDKTDNDDNGKKNSEPYT